MAKTSKRTEEEMLQETFAQFQAQATTEEAATESNNSTPGAVKSGNKNNLILIIGSVAAAGILGYIFLVKDRAPTAQFPTNQVAAVTPEQVQNPIVAPVVPVVPEVPTTPIAAPVQGPLVAEPLAPVVPVVPALDPIAQLQAQAQLSQVPVQAPVAPVTSVESVRTPDVDKFFAQGQNPVQPQVPVIDPVAPIIPSVPVVADVNPNPNINPNLNSGLTANPVAPIVPVSGLDAQQTNVVTELQNRFESQNNEFKNLISSVDGRVTNLEEKVGAHDARITRLEGFHEGQKAKVKPVEKKVQSSNAGSGNNSEVKAVAASEKAKAVVKRVRPVVKPKEEVIEDENVLFGSANVKRKEVARKAEKPVYQEYPIHSIYGGRFWLKNSDGSLSTYAAGDKLPSGEIVKDVNDEEFSIKTNLRTIVKR